MSESRIPAHAHGEKTAAAGTEAGAPPAELASTTEAGAPPAELASTTEAGAPPAELASTTEAGAPTAELAATTEAASTAGTTSTTETAVTTESVPTRVYTLDQMSDTIRQVLESGGEFRFYPRGTSMLPLLRQDVDSIALVAAPEKLHRRDIPLYTRPSGQYVLHRVVGEDADGYIMCGDNQTALEHGIRHSQICGVVTAIYRGKKQKRRDVTSAGYRIYSALWCFMPFRRFCMFCRRGALWLVRHLKCKKTD